MEEKISNSELFDGTIFDILSNNTKEIFGGNGYIAPNIPEKKLNGAIKGISQNSVTPNQVLFIVDETLFGSATDGLLFTKDTIYFNNSLLGKQGTLKYEDVKDTIYKKEVIKDDKGKEKIKEFVDIIIDDNIIIVDSFYVKDKRSFAIFMKSLAESINSQNINENVIERRPLEDMPIDIKVMYLKIIVNYLMEDGKIDDKEYSKLYNLIVRLKIDQDHRFMIIDYHNKLEDVDILLKQLFETVDIVMHKELQYSIIKDIIYINNECHSDKNYRESEFIKHIVGKLNIEDKQLDLIEEAIEADKKLFDDSVDDKGLETGIRELATGAAAVGVPMAALYFSGSVIGLGATGITSGLATLGFGGILGFSSMATGLGTILLLGYGAKKGMDVITGKGELDKRKRKEAMLLDVNKSMQRSMNCMMEDINYTIDQLLKAINANQELDAKILNITEKAEETIKKYVEKIKTQKSDILILTNRLNQQANVNQFIANDAYQSELYALRQRVPYKLDIERLNLLTEDPTRKQFAPLIKDMYDEECHLRQDLSIDELETLVQVLARIDYFSVTSAVNMEVNKVKGFFK